MSKLMSNWLPRNVTPSLILSCFVLLAASSLQAAIPYPAYIAAAVADKARPSTDVERDVHRHPADVMLLTGIKPGDRVVDVDPGPSAYFSRIMSRIVGSQGHVYLFNASALVASYPDAVPDTDKLIKEGYKNIESVVQATDAMHFDRPVDMIFMSLVYHDQIIDKVNVAAMNKAVFNALKPGGVFFVIDHVGPGVTTAEQMDKVHRIDPDLVKKQILAAGFVLESTSDLLKNPADPHNIEVFDKSIQGKTDQFIFKFVKPKK